MGVKDRDKNRKGKPQSFMSGFVAERHARVERNRFPSAEITVIPVAHGRGRQFLIKKVEAGLTTYWTDKGFVRLPGDVDGDPR